MAIRDSLIKTEVRVGTMETKSKPEIGRKLNYLLVMPLIACSAGTGYSLPLGSLCVIQP